MRFRKTCKVFPDEHFDNIISASKVWYLMLAAEAVDNNQKTPSERGGSKMQNKISPSSFLRWLKVHDFEYFILEKAAHTMQLTCVRLNVNRYWQSRNAHTTSFASTRCCAVQKLFDKLPKIPKLSYQESSWCWTATYTKKSKADRRASSGEAIFMSKNIFPLNHHEFETCSFNGDSFFPLSLWSRRNLHVSLISSSKLVYPYHSSFGYHETLLGLISCEKNWDSQFTSIVVFIEVSRWWGCRDHTHENIS